MNIFSIAIANKLAFKPGGGGVLPYKRLIGMCPWMGSHFHDWSDYNGVAFSIDLLEWGRKFSDSTAVARLGFKRCATAVLKSNLIRSIEIGTAVARRLKWA